MLGHTLFRIALAGLTGIIIGWASKSDPGARLFSLVCMGAALLAMVSVEYFRMLVLPGNVDPGRLSAQVISALGFIGSGLIWLAESKEVKSKRVHGTPTAASLWLTAILGLLIGAGMGVTAAGAIIFTALVLILNHIANLEKLIGSETGPGYAEKERKQPENKRGR